MFQIKLILPAITIKEQIENLRNLGLIIVDEEQAKQFLRHVSYFRFIKGYSLGLKDEYGQYKQGTTFEILCELYFFNQKLRYSLLPLIERLEISLRCQIINFFSVAYGSLGYENSENFARKDFHQQFLEEVSREVRQHKNSPFIKNFKNNYTDGKIPLYALSEIFTFGTTSKFIKNMLPKDKKEIARFYNMNYVYFESWIEAIAAVRNICAHYGRIYNAQFIKTPKLYKEYTKQGIGNHRLFAVLLCIKQFKFLGIEWDRFIEELQTLQQKYSHVRWETMDFPDNWLELLSK